MRQHVNTSIRQYVYTLVAGLFALATYRVGAQPVVVLDDETETATVGDVYVLPDPDGDATWEEIRAGHRDDDFAPAGDTSFTGEVSTYWVAFTLRNEARNQDRFFLEFENWLYVDVHPRAPDADTSAADVSTVMRTGRHVPFLSRDVPLANRNLVEIHLEPGRSRTYYARLHSDYSDIVVPSGLSFRIYSPESLWAGIARTRSLLGIFTGVYLVLFLYNLFIFLSIRDRNYLYYILLIGFLLIVGEWNSGYFVEYLQDFERFVIWHGSFDVLLSSIFGILVVQFTRSFLHLKSEMPLWDRMAKGIMAVLVVLPVPAFLGATFVAYNVSSVVGLVTCAVILTVAIKSYRAGFPSASYFLLAYSFFLTGLAVFLLTDLGVLPAMEYSVFAIQFGSVAEGVLFSFALANRINTLRAENENLLTAANRELEWKVRERTREVEDQNTELAAQRDHLMELNEELATANDAIRLQAEEIEKAYHELERTYDRLKSTQAQLVQREKLASLGELAAGIAHEVKNPLNFVNNFSDLSIELIDELEEEITERSGAGADTASVKEALAMLRVNLGKISEHGRRADGIVKSMLEHSRGMKGESRAVDVNRMVEEYVNLSVHGMRAKIPDFSVEVERDFEEMIGAVEVVPQEIGRVLLNLLNNAFYAVLERAARENGAYQAMVTVRTRSTADGGVEIRVEDNGPGIDADTAAKIFQPFFTTKPTGEGTGLGLSLSYEIVTQMHGGSLTVERSASGGAAFVIHLPATQDATAD